MSNQMQICIFSLVVLMVGSTFALPSGAETVDLNENMPLSNNMNLKNEVRESPDFGNTYSTAHDLGQPPVNSISGVVTGMSDEDWFKIRLKGDDGTGMVDNLTVIPTSLSSSAGSWMNDDTFQVYIFGSYNHGGPFPDSKLVFMDSQGYQPWNSFQSSWKDCYSMAFDTGDYYVMVKGYFDLGIAITYTLSINIESDPLADKNQIPLTATKLTEVSKQYTLEQAGDLFDWYKLESTAEPDMPINFSFSLNIVSSPPAWTETGALGSKPINFYCEVIVVVLHDINKAPAAVMRLSNSGLYGLNSTIFYSETTIEKTGYIGIFVQMYGRDTNGGGPYYFVGHGKDTDKYMGGYAKYDLKGSALQIIDSVLVNPEVKPLRGRTYDDYTFSVIYKDENNKAPLSARIKIDDLNFEDMYLKEFNYTLDNYRDGAIYESKVNGFKLGEGFHKYSFYFKDPDGFSTGSTVLHSGPYITDNVEPQIRLTALDSINLREDCSSAYVNLLDIFHDAEGDRMIFNLKQDSSWVSSTQSVIAAYRIMANDTLRITPEENAYGNDVLFINATDSNGNWLIQPFELNVIIEPVNDPPQVKKYLGEWVIEEDSKIRDIDLNDYFFDPVELEQELEFGYEDVENIDIYLQVTGTKTVIIPHENWFGELSIKFYAFDGTDTVYNVMRLHVISVNDPPVFLNPRGFTINESQWFYRDMIAYDPIEGDDVHIETNLTDEVNSILLKTGRIITPSDGGVVPGENLIIEKDSINSSIHHFAFYPTNPMAGSMSEFTGIYYINFTAVDSGGARVTRSVIISIINVNQAPQPIINRPLNGSLFYEEDLIYFFGDAGDPDVIHGGHNFYTWSSDINGELGKTKYLGPVTLSSGLHTITLESGNGEKVGRASIQVRVGRVYKPPPPPPPPPPIPSEDGGSSIFSLSYESKMILAVAILIILSVITFGFTIKSRAIVAKKLRTGFKLDFLRLPSEVQEILSPQKALCSYCGSTIQVISKVRPISIMCSDCGKRSVMHNNGLKIENQIINKNPNRKQLMP